MTELIALASSFINGAEIQTVNARDLHLGLEIGRDFSNWVKAQIQRGGFEENVDYVKTQDLSSPKTASAKSRVQMIIEYHFTISAAKHIAMMSQSAKGKKIRDYFIRCEENLKAVENKAFAPKSMLEEKVRSYFMLAQFMADEEHMTLPVAKAYALDAIHTDTGLLTEPFRKLLPAIEPKDQAHLNATQIGEKVGLSAVNVNKFLAELGFIEKNKKVWQLTDTGTKYGEAKPYTRNGHSGYDIKWRDSVLSLFPQEA